MKTIKKAFAISFTVFLLISPLCISILLSLIFKNMRFMLILIGFLFTLFFLNHTFNNKEDVKRIIDEFVNGSIEGDTNE